MKKEEKLEGQLSALNEKIEAFKEQSNFEERFYDGHSPSISELERHHREMREKLESNLQSYEEKFGHLNMFEKQLILFMGTIEN
jgi:predicted  nucleic acid-binding Zn-ribbon protein